jgi:hypothetical protein
MFNASTTRVYRVLAVAVTLLMGHGAAAGLAPGAKLCMHPLTLPFRGGDSDPRRASIEQRLTAALVSASFQVVEPSRVKAVSQRELKAVGGVIDPAIGWRLPERYQAYRDRLGRALARELGCDVQLVTSVVLVRASFQNGTAKWDGASQQVSSTGRIVLNALGGTVESGWVSAFSLWLRVLDLAGNDLAFRSAGIEALVHFAVLEDKDLLPEDQWLTDGTKLDAAIASALGPGGGKLRGQDGTD